MDYTAKEKLCRRISSGRSFLPYKDLFIVFKDPDQNLIADSEIIYDIAIEENNGSMININESFEILKKKGLWSDDKDLKIEEYKRQIKILKEELWSSRFIEKRLRFLNTTIKNTENELDKLIKLKNSLYGGTIECFAEMQKRRFLIKNITTIKNAKVELSVDLIDDLSRLYFEDNAVTEKEIRELARTNPWRIFWATSKETATPLFDKPSTMMTYYQQMLVSWSFIYDSAFQSLNKPSDDIIENDDLFDKWYQDEQNRIKNDQKSQQNNGYGNKELFLMSDKEGAKKVYDLNTPEQKEKIKQRMKIIKEKGSVTDLDFPDVKRDIQIQSNNTFFNRK